MLTVVWEVGALAVWENPHRRQTDCLERSIVVVESKCSIENGESFRFEGLTWVFRYLT